MQLNPCNAEYFYVLPSSPIFKLFTCSISDISLYLQAEWKTVWILIRWLRQKPADLDLQCFEKKTINLGSVGQELIQVRKRSDHSGPS